MIVVDTNTIAHLFIQGDRTQACRAVFRKDPAWAAPFLWRSEFRNVLTTHMRHAGMPLDGAKRRMAEAEKHLEGREYLLASEAVLKLTHLHPVSAYDAEFVCLADILDTRLVTTDKRLLKTFPELAIDPESFTG